MAEADIVVGAFNQAGNVADGKTEKVLVFDDADLRMERRERVGGDLRPRVGDGGEQRGFAGVGVADESDLGDEAQLEEVVAFVARFAGLGEARGLVAGGGEVAVAQAAAATFAQDELLAVLGEVGDKFGVFGGKLGTRRVGGFVGQVDLDGACASGMPEQGTFGRAKERAFGVGSVLLFVLRRFVILQAAAVDWGVSRRGYRREL